MASSHAYLSPSTHPPSLDTLVSHLLAAKRSLSCIDHVSRANELVTSTRRALTQQTALGARTGFLRSGCIVQLEYLSQVHNQLGSIADESASEFEDVIRHVETAQFKLESTLECLRNTIVDSKLRPKGEKPKSLLDFVEETGVQGLRDEVRESLHETTKARKQYREVIGVLGKEVMEIKTMLSLPSRDDDVSEYASSQSPVPDIMRNMETSAHEMAQNLESLVNHYDLCLNALRHTEGAGAAFSQASNNDLPEDQNAALAHEIEVDAAPMSTADRDHMLSVLLKDADEVDEVVAEVREGITTMESSYDDVLAHGKFLLGRWTPIVEAFKLLESVGSRLSHYVSQSQLFVVQTDDEKSRILDKQTQLEDMTRFYAGFLGAYDNLIIEVGRRKDVVRRMARIRERALAEIEELYQEDLREREVFRLSQGSFLPMDIWPGLMATPAKYEIGLVEGQGSVPDISASVIQKAIRRANARPENGGECSI